MSQKMRPYLPTFGALAALESTLANFRISTQTMSWKDSTSKRHAQHAAQGRANGAKDGPGKRLGAKKTAGQYVVTGNILYRQRGTLWFPGDNCFMGRDHTIHAAVPGYVTYYLDPKRHPKRKYIGVVFERDQTLPQPPNAVRRRRLGMLAHQMKQTTVEQIDGENTTEGTLDSPGSASKPTNTIRDTLQEIRAQRKKTSQDEVEPHLKIVLRPGYQNRQANWDIGRSAERSEEAQKVTPFKPRDRFLAWRKRNARKAKAAERRAMVRSQRGKKSKK